MNYKKAIRKRKSTRKYKNKKLDDKILNSIENKIEDTNTLLSNQIEARVIEREKIESFVSGIIGDYRKIESPYYLVISSKGQSEDLIDVGFLGEKIILDLTKQELGTCWIGKIGDKKDIKRELGLKNIPKALIAFGYAKNKATRDKEPDRKNLNELIIEGQTNSLTQDILELVKLGPSAVNQQPWRFLLKEKQIDFYLTKKGLFKKLLKKISNLEKLNYIDMGIALRHAELGLREKEKEPKFHQKQPKKDRKKLEYIISLKTP
ncbi:MAG: Nitroreductase [Candidatus Methanohalarchaeum thermophilum]|uniref:Nitroreductase n=1 Tax=Methanohalarchaeum thermophilum TaxID=1903181 RepID=A0A1Q6DSH1_METT1|nr:MAG: Nitroreductase [Candidatus Methanohalarchaeum thermophilum]